MIRLSELLGHDALALGSATKAGTVTGIAIEKHRIVAIGVSGSTIAGSAVNAFDGDVLTFDERLSNNGFEAIVTTSDPRGTRVLDVHGDGLGVVTDMTISTDGAIEAIVVSTGEVLLGSRLVTIGSYAAIISVEASS